MAESPEANTWNDSRPRWPIAAWVVITIVVAGAGIIGTLYYSSSALRDTGRFVVNQELLAHHWSKLETDREFTPIIQSMASAWSIPQTELKWSVKRLGTPANPAADVDAFEAASLDKISAGQTEVWSYSPVNGSRYVRAVRVGSNCMACHAATQKGQFLRANDVIGVISVDFRPNRPSPTQSVALNTDGN
jgi:hypothetical protein